MSHKLHSTYKNVKKFMFGLRITIYTIVNFIMTLEYCVRLGSMSIFRTKHQHTTIIQK